MHGWIHQATKTLVLDTFGPDKWEEILRSSNLKDAQILKMEVYPDFTTEHLINTVEKITRIPKLKLWKKFGHSFVVHCVDSGWKEIMVSLGRSLKDFLNGLDALHYFVDQLVFNTRIQSPSFHCESLPCGRLLLHYYSKRTGLYPIVEGAIEEISSTIFNCKVQINLIRRKIFVVETTSETDAFVEHVTFEIRQESAGDEKTSFQPVDVSGALQMTLREFCIAFPYHICFDKDLIVQHAGLFVMKVFPSLTMERTITLDECFEIVHPDIQLNYDNFITFHNSVFVFKLKAVVNSLRSQRILRLKGQMLLLENGKILFLCSPYLTTVKELVERGVRLGDIPLYDRTRDIVLLNQSRISQIQTHKKLEAAVDQLRKMKVELEQEKDRADCLLEQLLPHSIAEDLKMGKLIEPTEFEQCTVLFSDVVKFTVLCSKCTPIEVIELLSDLYSRFDGLTQLNKVYKVETIGDAYMVAGGVPTPTEDHAESVINQGIGMLFHCKQVKTPTKAPIEMRIGVYSGSVVAGVVGYKMPRYCLFGDTVNFAHGLEAQGIPGKLLLGNSTLQCIPTGTIEITERKHVQINGKTIIAYILRQNNCKSVWQIIDTLPPKHGTATGYTELYETTTQVLRKENVLSRTSYKSRQYQNYLNSPSNVKSTRFCSVS